MRVISANCGVSQLLLGVPGASEKVGLGYS